MTIEVDITVLKKTQPEDAEWDGITFWEQEDLIKDNPNLSTAEEIDCECCCEDCSSE